MDDTSWLDRARHALALARAVQGFMTAAGAAIVYVAISREHAGVQQTGYVIISTLIAFWWAAMSLWVWRSMPVERVLLAVERAQYMSRRDVVLCATTPLLSAALLAAFHGSAVSFGLLVTLSAPPYGRLMERFVVVPQADRQLAVWLEEHQRPV